jgi:molybdopterin-guanine dinucleotide biosynthesis protein MobB|tara:strand:+ start:203 stop:745 length:543 start_codon:yes stop_codon:yes gene_type:complete
LKQKIIKSPCVIGVCAANSGSGKTTLIEKLIPQLIKKGLAVSVIKHAHHKFDIDTPGKDSFRIREAGAYQTLIFNNHRSALITENVKNIFNIDQAITQISSDTDIILIEGLKDMNYPKIEVHRKDISNKILCEKDSNIIAIISDLFLDVRIPSFDLNDISSIVDFIVQYINSYRTKKNNG